MVWFLTCKLQKKMQFTRRIELFRWMKLNLSLQTVSIGSKSTAWHVEALLQKVSDASHIQMVWKGLWGFRSLSRYSVFDLFNFTPVKIQRTGRFQNVNVVYHSHHNAYISCFRTLRSLQNPRHMVKRMIPRDIPGILDFPGRWNYLWPICQFFPVCLQAARKERFWHPSAKADTCSADQQKLHIQIWRDCFMAIY